MTIEAINYEEVIDFIDNHYLKNTSQVNGSQSKTIIDSAVFHTALLSFRDDYRHFKETGEWLKAYQISVSGWPTLEGVMITMEEPQWNAKIRAVLFTQNERVLRQLLFKLPRGRLIYVCVFKQWMLRTIEELLDGCRIPSIEDKPVTQTTEDPVTLYSFVGIKKGSGRFEHAATKRPDFFKSSNIHLVDQSKSNLVLEGSITEKKHPILMELNELNSLNKRLLTSKFVAEGLLLLKRAVVDGLPLENVVYTTGFLMEENSRDFLNAAYQQGIPCHKISDGLMGAITQTRPVPTLLGSIHTHIREVEQYQFHAKTSLLITESVSNPDNLGMILRTADASGIEAVVVIGNSASPFHKNCIRSARGAVGRIPILYCADEVRFFENLKAFGFSIIGTSAKANTALYSIPLHGPVAFIVGNETSGIREDILCHCTHTVKIPMYPGQSSLNVGVATGILLYELVRHKLQP